MPIADHQRIQTGRIISQSLSAPHVNPTPNANQIRFIKLGLESILASHLCPSTPATGDFKLQWSICWTAQHRNEFRWKDSYECRSTRVLPVPLRVKLLTGTKTSDSTTWMKMRRYVGSRWRAWCCSCTVRKFRKPNVKTSFRECIWIWCNRPEERPGLRLTGKRQQRKMEFQSKR